MAYRITITFDMSQQMSEVQAATPTRLFDAPSLTCANQMINIWLLGLGCHTQELKPIKPGETRKIYTHQHATNSFASVQRF